MVSSYMHWEAQEDVQTRVWPQVESSQSTDCLPSLLRLQVKETIATMKRLSRWPQMRPHHRQTSDLSTSPLTASSRGSLLLAGYLFVLTLASTIHQTSSTSSQQYSPPSTTLHRIPTHPRTSKTNLLGPTLDEDESFSESSQENLEPDQDEPVEVARGAPGTEHLLMSQRHHSSRLRAVRDILERRHLASQQQLQASQELSPMSIGLDSGNGSPFGVAPFAVPNHEVVGPAIVPKAVAMSNSDNMDPHQLSFGLNPLPHLLGFQGSPFDAGLQRGDQSVNSHHQIMEPNNESGTIEPLPQTKSWPKIFRFTDGRINLSEFEKQKKIRLSNKNQHNGDNHIESAPIMFDGRPLKRKTFLILHGGIFPSR